MSVVTPETVLQAYQQLMTQAQNPDLINSAVQFLRQFCSDPRSVPIHLELLRQVTDPKLVVWIVLGISETVAKEPRRIGGEIVAQVEAVFLEELAKRPSREVTQTMFETLGKMVSIGTVHLGEQMFENTFRFALSLIGTDFPQDLLLDLWAAILQTYLKRNSQNTVELYKMFFDWAMTLLASKESEIRAHTLTFIDSMIASITESSPEPEIQWAEMAAEPLMEALNQIAQSLFQEKEVTTELKTFLFFFSNVFEDPKVFVTAKSEPVMRTAVVALANMDVSVGVRMCVHELLTCALSFLVEEFCMEDMLKMAEVSIKLTVEACRQAPDEWSYWQSTEDMYLEMLEHDCFVEMFVQFTSVLFASADICERLVGMLVLKSIASAQGKCVTREMVMTALGVADVDDETVVSTACQLIDAMCATPMIVVMCMNELVEYLLKWGKYNIVFRTLGNVIKSVKKPPMFFTGLMEKLFSLFNGANMQIANDLLYALGRCCARPDCPVEELFDKFGPVLETAIRSHRDFAPVVLMCFGNMVRVAPQHVAKNLPKILEYAGNFMREDSCIAWAKAARMIMKIAAYLPKSLEPFLPKIVPVMMQAVFGPVPDTEEMKIEYNRIAYTKMQQKCMLCLGVIARELPEYGASLGGNLWKLILERLDLQTCYAKLVTILCPILVEQHCDMGSILHQVFNQVYPQWNQDVLRILLDTLQVIVLHNTKEFAMQHKATIIDHVLSAYSGIYHGYVMSDSAECKIPAVLQCALYRLLLTVVDQARDGMAPDIEGIFTRMKVTGKRLEAMRLHICAKMLFYCQSECKIEDLVLKEAFNAWKTANKHDTLYHLIMTFLCLFKIGNGMRLAQYSEGFLKVSCEMMANLPVEYRSVRCAITCFWTTLIMIYGVEVDPETVASFISPIRLQANTEILPFFAPFYSWAHSKWPEVITPTLPQAAAAIFSSDPAVVSRIPEETLKFFIAVAANIKEEQWSELLYYNESHLAKVLQNIQRLTQ